MAIEELKQNSETKTFTLNLNNCTRPFFLFSRCVMSDSFTTPWPVACQASLSMGFPRREYWSRLPFPSPRDLPDPGIEPTSPVAPALWADSLPAEPLGKPVKEL